LEDVVPAADVAVEAAHALLVGRLRRHAGIVDEGMQRLAVEQRLRLGDEGIDALGVAEIGGDVVRPVGIALAFRRHRLARAGDDLPAGLAEMPHGGMADAAAGAGEDETLALRAHRSTLIDAASDGQRRPRVGPWGS